MGLDVSVFKAAYIVAEGKFDEDNENEYDRQGLRYLHSCHPGRADEMREGWYQVEYARDPDDANEPFIFRAGSYSGYNAWRNTLSWLAHGVAAEVVWGNPETYASKRFQELIDFSDCEGLIGPRTSAKLARDFQGFCPAREQVEQFEREHADWWLKKYEMWKQAFMAASMPTGCVYFH